MSNLNLISSIFEGEVRRVRDGLNINIVVLIYVYFDPAVPHLNTSNAVRQGPDWPLVWTP